MAQALRFRWPVAQRPSPPEATVTIHRMVCRTIGKRTDRQGDRSRPAQLRVQPRSRRQRSGPVAERFGRYQAGKTAARRVQGPQGQGEEGQELGKVALTRDFKELVKERAARDPAFSKAMLDEAATAFLNGEPHVSRLILRDLVNASVGFEDLAAETKHPSKSLHRMLSEKGNPSMDNLAAIFGAVRKHLGVEGA